jgi:c-di-GMP-binding flagellar brake protein YcgR
MPSSKPAFVKSSKSASDKDKNDAARCRRHPRFRGDFQVAVSQLIENQYRKLEGHCRDLSEAGMGIILAADVGTGEVLNLTFSLPGSVPPWDVRAVVRFRQGCQYGLEFLSLSEDCRRCIQNYLKSLQPVD